MPCLACPSATSICTTAHQFCHYSGDQFHVLVTDHADGVSYSVKPMCVETQDVADACVNQQTCEEPPNTWKFMVFQTSPGSPNVPWGTVCLDTDTANEFDVITPGKVFKEMQKLAWPEAEMVIQPPDGRTLVNLETNFLTTTTEPTTQSIQLLGHGVEIEATPVSYLWHFGDGASQEGSDPGAEYPDLRITHVYVEAGVDGEPERRRDVPGPLPRRRRRLGADPRHPDGRRDPGRPPGALGDPAPRGMTR